jgi:hypothetical protein
MVSTTDLFNLDLGEKYPGSQFGDVRVGPFVVKLADDYAARVREMPHNASRTDSGDTPATFQEASGVGWHVTATATLVGAPEDSVLTEPPAKDGGLWDLCALLTCIPCTKRRPFRDQPGGAFSAA